MHWDDWTVIYKDGVSVFGDHRVDPEDVLDVLDIEYTHRFINNWDYDKEIPEKLEDLPEE